MKQAGRRAGLIFSPIFATSPAAVQALSHAALKSRIGLPTRENTQELPGKLRSRISFCIARTSYSSGARGIVRASSFFVSPRLPTTKVVPLIPSVEYVFGGGPVCISVSGGASYKYEVSGDFTKAGSGGYFDASEFDLHGNVSVVEPSLTKGVIITPDPLLVVKLLPSGFEFILGKGTVRTPNGKLYRMPELTAAGPEAQAAGMRLLQAARKAIGGAALAAVKDVIQVVDIQPTRAALNYLPSKRTFRWIVPTYFRQASGLSFYWDGKAGWALGPQGTTPIGGMQLNSLQVSFFHNYLGLMLADRVGYQVIMASEHTIEFSDAGLGRTAQLRLDPDTDMPISMSWESVDVTGPPGPRVLVEETYGDFREVNGLKVPFRVTITHNSRKWFDNTVLEYKINTGQKPEDLSEREK